ncbi:MAG: hypothetical protein ACREUW_14200 [Burkholderiales bacterium]
MTGDLGNALLLVFGACAAAAYFAFYVIAGRERRGRTGISRDKDC